MGIRDLEKHNGNPYLKDLTQYQRGVKRTVVKGGKAILDTSTGELENVAEIVQIEKVDTEKFVKLYTDDLQRFFSLTPKAQRLLQVVLEQVQKSPDNDLISLNVPLAIDYFDRHSVKPMVRQSIYAAIEEMVKKGFIAKSALHLDQYFINPAIFFNGSRIRLVKEYQITKQSSLPGIN
jgi:hypothetical protein